jgi:hypothetical protein
VASIEEMARKDNMHVRLQEVLRQTGGNRFEANKLLTDDEHARIEAQMSAELGPEVTNAMEIMKIERSPTLEE